jgi:hypothetical protein
VAVLRGFGGFVVGGRFKVVNISNWDWLLVEVLSAELTES